MASAYAASFRSTSSGNPPGKRAVANLMGWPLLVFFCFSLLLLLPSIASAQRAAIRLQAFPQAILADGASTTQITVEVLNESGGPIANGTQVLLETTLGTLSTNLVTTQNGFARVTLTAGRLTGTAKLTASIVELRATALLEVRFVGSREELENERFQVELVAPNRLTYSPTQRIVRADGPGQRAHLKAKAFDLYADDLQYFVLTNEVLAKRARLRVDGVERFFSELRLNIREVQGYGLTTYEVEVPVIKPSPPLFTIRVERRERTGLVDIQRSQIRARTAPIPTDAFEFVVLEEATTLVYARKATILPEREVLFNDATIDIEGNRVFRVPLFRVSTQNVPQVITEEYIQVANNQLNVDFPYYLNLSAAGDTNLRFRYGTRFARGTGAAQGMYLDFERSWNFGEGQEGFFSFQGMGRKDWGLAARQRLRLWEGGNAYLQGNLPANRAIVGSLGFDSRLSRYGSINYNLSAARSIRGPKNSNYDQSVSIRRDPQRLKGTNWSFSFGAVGATRGFESASVDIFARSVGLDLQTSMQPIRLGGGVFNASTRVARLWGQNVRQGLTTGVSLGWNRPLDNLGGLTLSYDFSDDFFSSSTIGKHRVSAEVNVSSGNLYVFLFGANSIGVQRTNVLGDMSYRFSPLWRMGLTSTYDRFGSNEYTDVSVVVAYTLGLREIGLSWSQRRNRIGIEILGTPIR